MKANKCPNCKEEVMPYKVFIKEAEPGKTSKCSSCGTNLNRSKMAVPFVLGMIIIGLALPTYFIATNVNLSEVSLWSKIGFSVAYLTLWTIAINYLAWLFIGWESVEKSE